MFVSSYRKALATYELIVQLNTKSWTLRHLTKKNVLEFGAYKPARL